VAVAARASERTLGVATEAQMSTVLRGRRLFVELNRGWRRIDAYDRQLTGRRAAGVHVETEVISPGVGRASRTPAMLGAAG
jgi:hypothetical protein